MKAFDEWSHKTYYQWDALDSNSKMKIAWKAALEWVKSQQISEYDDFIYISVIEEELEE